MLLGFAAAGLKVVAGVRAEEPRLSANLTSLLLVVRPGAPSSVLVPIVALGFIDY